MFILENHVSTFILQVESHAAELGTFSSVCTAVETILGCIALSAVTNAEGAVNKNLQWRVACLMDFFNLLQREFACDDESLKSNLAEKTCFLRRADVHLCAGVERDG